MREKGNSKIPAIAERSSIFTLLTRSEKETVAFANKFARTLKGGEVILLIGELGAGKTTFTRALARALGIKEKIKSPTFVLMHIHKIVHSTLKYLVHCDAYRVNAQSLQEVGLMDWIGRPDTIVVVEWGEKIKPLLKGRQYQVIKFKHGKLEQERIIEIAR